MMHQNRTKIFMRKWLCHFPFPRGKSRREPCELFRFPGHGKTKASAVFAGANHRIFRKTSNFRGNIYLYKKKGIFQYI